MAEILILVPNREQGALPIFPPPTQPSYMIAEERVEGFGGIPSDPLHLTIGHSINFEN